MKTTMMAAALAFGVWGAPVLADPEVPQNPDPVVTPSTEPAPVYVQPVYTQAPPDRPAEPNVMRGLTMLVGGGVEGYTGALASEIRPGGTWGVEAAVKPTKVLGLEIGYSGAANNINAAMAPDETGVTGPDIIRNGGHLVATLGLSASALQPYLLGGVGIDHYSIRAGQAEGFHDDNNGNIPVGAGLRSHTGNFTADLRFDYGLPINQSFAPGASSSWGAGRYQGLLQLGATF